MKKTITHVLLLLATLLPFKSWSESLIEDDELLWELSIGTFWVDATLTQLTGAKSNYSVPSLLIDAKVQYKNFYLNTRSGDFYGGSNFGYQLVLEDNWGVDLIYGSYQLEFNERGYYDTEDVVDELRGIRERESDQSLGFAYYFTHENFQTVAEAVFDVFGDSDGWLLHLDTTRNFEVRNWDIWVNVGANYYSSSFIDYYFGVDSYEATKFRPEHEIDSATAVYIQLQADYPIAQNWVFSAGSSGLMYSSNIVRSPLVSSRYSQVFFAGVKYVF